MTRAKRFAILSLVLVVFAAALVLKEVRRSPAAPERNTEAETAGNTAAQDVPLPRLVDLGSTTCIPCKMMAPILEELKREYEGRMVVEVIDVRTDRAKGVQYGIKVIPTQVFLSPEGEEVFRHEGFMSKEDILAKWAELGIDVEAGGSAKGRE